MTKNIAPSSPYLTGFENWLDSFLNFEKLPQKNMFWLDTMEYLAKLAGNPELSYPTFHVAGSKGKGSTSAFIASILEEAGLKTGLYSSPHIVNFLERITQNQNFLTQKTYEDAAEELKCLINCTDSKTFLKNRPITWFELVTLYSFLCFRKAKLDAAVFEVGLGGRLDATNVIKPKVCCIGPIELEHTEYLGDTLEKIAAEKGGIIKEKTPVFIAPQIPSVKEVFKSIASQKDAKIFFIDEICKISTQIYTSSEKIKTKAVISSSFFSRPLTAELNLAGEFQAQNAALAALAVKTAFPEISEDIIEKGLSKTSLPARFELIKNPQNFSEIPYLVLDGAHTPKSIKLTLETIKNANIKIDALLFACAQDKHSKEIAELFSQSKVTDSKNFQKIFLTVPGNVKKSDLSEVENSFASAGLAFDSDSDYKKQIEKVLDFCNSNKKTLLITGSFYLVAEVTKILGTRFETPQVIS